MPVPAAYVATGGHGGIVGQASHTGLVYLTYVPVFKHTYQSDVRLTVLPAEVTAAARIDGRLTTVAVPVKDQQGKLLGDAIPSVSIVKDGGFMAESFGDDPEVEADLSALVVHKLSLQRPAGFVLEGLVPYGAMTSELRQQIMITAAVLGPAFRPGRTREFGRLRRPASALHCGIEPDSDQGADAADGLSAEIW